MTTICEISRKLLRKYCELYVNQVENLDRQILQKLNLPKLERQEI